MTDLTPLNAFLAGASLTKLASLLRQETTCIEDQIRADLLSCMNEFRQGEPPPSSAECASGRQVATRAEANRPAHRRKNGNGNGHQPPRPKSAPAGETLESYPEKLRHPLAKMSRQIWDALESPHSLSALIETNDWPSDDPTRAVSCALYRMREQGLVVKADDGWRRA